MGFNNDGIELIASRLKKKGILLLVETLEKIKLHLLKMLFQII